MAAKTSEKPVAAVYAQALYEAAVEKNVLREVSAELDALRSLAASAPEIERFLVSPTISFEAKKKTLNAALKELNQVTRNFLLVLIERDRGGLLNAVIDAFVDYSNKKAGLATIEVFSPQKLGDGEREQLTSVLAKKLNQKITLKETLRPDLLGGMVVLHGDKMWDGSLATRLRRLTEKMGEVKLEAARWSE